MKLNLIELNWMAISICIILNSTLGGLWFTKLFGNQYYQSLGMTYNSNSKPDLKYIMSPLVSGIVTTIATSILISNMNITTLTDILTFSFVVGFGLISTTNINSGFNPKIYSPIQYGIVSGGYFLFISLIITSILVWLA